MKLRFLTLCVGVFLALAAGAAASVYFVNDDSAVGDIYTSALGHDGNSGTASNAPKRTLNNLIGTTAWVPGDVVYIDTGIYGPVVFSNTVNGAAGFPILFQGSTNFAAGGTMFTGGGDVVTVNGRYLNFRDFRAVGGITGIKVNETASQCDFERVWGVSNNNHAVWMNGGSSNTFRHCIFSTLIYTSFTATGKDNSVENCIAISREGTGFNLTGAAVSNLTGCIAVSKNSVSGGESTRGTRNIFWPREAFHLAYGTLADFQCLYTNWFGNTIANPKFVNAEALDFHLLSASGFVSNGVWVTNPAVGYSPGIDFGERE